MDAKLEGEIREAKYLFDRISWPAAALGIWPKNLTLCGQIKFAIFITYFIVQLYMEIAGVVDDLEKVDEVITGLMVTVPELMTLYRILIIRFDKKIRKIVQSIEEDLVIEHFRDTEEMKILLRYLSLVDKFYRFGTRALATTSLLYYLIPLENYIIGRIMNGTAILTCPWQVAPYIDISTTERTLIVYAIQFPMISIPVIYATCYGILFGFISSLCAQLAILTHRITIMKDDNSDPRIVFQQHTQQHVKIVMIAQTINDVFHLVLLYDLVLTTVVIGVVIYQFLLTVDEADVINAVPMLVYVSSMILLVYVNCFMGECLHTECTALLNSYYECNWYEMSPFYKNALIICISTTQESLQLTAGKFYVFSMENFSKIMKSSMVYVSLLRTLF